MSVVLLSAGVVVEDSGAVVSLSAGVIVESSVVGVSLSAGVLLEVGAAGSADGSVATASSGAWVLFCCEPTAVITSFL